MSSENNLLKTWKILQPYLPKLHQDVADRCTPWQSSGLNTDLKNYALVTGKANPPALHYHQL